MTGMIKMPLGTKVGLGPGNIVLDADPAPPEGAQPPNFGPCLLCQTAGWIKMPLGTKIGLGPGRIVLYGDGAPTIFGPCLLWPNGRPSQLLLSTC